MCKILIATLILILNYGLAMAYALFTHKVCKVYYSKIRLGIILISISYDLK
jgi:hypothetical protein